VAALIDNDELDSKTREVERLNELVDIVTTYELNKKDESRRASGKNSPGVLDIIESMKKQKGYDYYTYVNADIELLTNLKRFNICEAIHEISNSKRVVFSHRRDYVLVPEIYHDYLQGLEKNDIAKRNRILSDWPSRLGLHATTVPTKASGSNNKFSSYLSQGTPNRKQCELGSCDFILRVKYASVVDR